ncbi:hypothetical protein PHMEG_00012644 [Phytophthora megakarya]|uniref:CCHC-type domain-containing protein n=1 Tax=Phytophthora megakarya TaxID=4795 RepID=A0A225W882_9STRA|nr:hypothetical protein PHMEG_00012644 [Phytophthora megakarya]
MGRRLRTPNELLRGTELTEMSDLSAYDKELLATMKSSHECAERARRKDQERQAKYYNQRNVRNKKSFKKGDRVWMYRLPRGAKATKFVHAWIGPMKIVDEVGNENYLIEREEGENHDADARRDDPCTTKYEETSSAGHYVLEYELGPVHDGRSGDDEGERRWEFVMEYDAGFEAGKYGYRTTVATPEVTATAKVWPMGGVDGGELSSGRDFWRGPREVDLELEGMKKLSVANGSAHYGIPETLKLFGMEWLKYEEQRTKNENKNEKRAFTSIKTLHETQETKQDDDNDDAVCVEVETVKNDSNNEEEQRWGHWKRRCEQSARRRDSMDGTTSEIEDEPPSGGTTEMAPATPLDTVAATLQQLTTVMFGVTDQPQQEAALSGNTEVTVNGKLPGAKEDEGLHEMTVDDVTADGRSLKMKVGDEMNTDGSRVRKTNVATEGFDAARAVRTDGRDPGNDEVEDDDGQEWNHPLRTSSSSESETISDESDGEAGDLELPTFTPSPKVSVATLFDRVDLALKGAATSGRGVWRDTFLYFIMPGEAHADFAAGLRDVISRNKVNERVLLARFYRDLDKTTRKLVQQRPVSRTLEEAVDKATAIDDPMDNVAQRHDQHRTVMGDCASRYFVYMTGTIGQMNVIGIYNAYSGTWDTPRGHPWNRKYWYEPKKIVRRLESVASFASKADPKKPAPNQKAKGGEAMSSDSEPEDEPRKKLKAAVKQAVAEDVRRNASKATQCPNGHKCYECNNYGHMAKECPDQETQACNDEYLKQRKPRADEDNVTRAS